MVILEIIDKLTQLNKEQKMSLEQHHEEFIELSKSTKFSDMPMDEL
ncbi:MAG: hypothetical protein ACQ9CV_00630 [Nitrosopumilus sp.]|mgnify:CR=1 FL=1